MHKRDTWSLLAVIVLSAIIAIGFMTRPGTTILLIISTGIAILLVSGITSIWVWLWARLK